MEFKKFLEIRKMYSELLPAWILEYEKTGDMRQDPYFMNWEFTPIEEMVWRDIRTFGIPFFPQIPVLNYFLDFGCPFLKIGIECDGKAWHSHDLDKARDARLAAEGWMIFRIEGHECKRFIDPWDECEEENSQLIKDYFMTTSEGIISAIKRKYFDNDYGKYQSEISHTLFEHRSTPETSPVLIAHKKSMPELAGNYLDSYLEDLIDRVKRDVA